MAIDMTTGRIFLIDDAGAWRLDLSTGDIGSVIAVERVIFEPSTGQIAVIVLASTSQ